jgi:hypothetical protein
MTRRADDIKAISGQAQIKCSYQRAGREFGPDQHVAENADALSDNDCLDGM